MLLGKEGKRIEINGFNLPFSFYLRFHDLSDAIRIFEILFLNKEGKRIEINEMI